MDIQHGKNREPKVVTEFKAALIVYIDAIRRGSMDISIINNLTMALDNLKNHKEYDRISVQLTTEELEILVGCIHEYTTKLAHDNYVELTEKELNVDDKKDSATIINLQNYLKAQKRIFETAV